MIILWAFRHQRSTKCGKPSFPSLCPNQKGVISWHFLVFFAFVNLIFSSSFFSQALQAGDSWQLPAFLLPFLEIWFFPNLIFSLPFFKAAPASNSWKSQQREGSQPLFFPSLWAQGKQGHQIVLLKDTFLKIKMRPIKINWAVLWKFIRTITCGQKCHCLLTTKIFLCSPFGNFLQPTENDLFTLWILNVHPAWPPSQKGQGNQPRHYGLAWKDQSF